MYFSGIVGCYLLLYAPLVFSAYAALMTHPQLLIISLCAAFVASLALIITSFFFILLQQILPAAFFIIVHIIITGILRILLFLALYHFESLMRRHRQIIVLSSIRFGYISLAVGVGFATISSLRGAGTLLDATRRINIYTIGTCAYDMNICPRFPILFHSTIQAFMIFLSQIAWAVMTGQSVVALKELEETQEVYFPFLRYFYYYCCFCFNKNKNNSRIHSHEDEVEVNREVYNSSEKKSCDNNAYVLLDKNISQECNSTGRRTPTELHNVNKSKEEIQQKQKQKQQREEEEEIKEENEKQQKQQENEESERQEKSEIETPLIQPREFDKNILEDVVEEYYDNDEEGGYNNEKEEFRRKNNLKINRMEKLETLTLSNTKEVVNSNINNNNNQIHSSNNPQEHEQVEQTCLVLPSRLPKSTLLYKKPYLALASLISAFILHILFSLVSLLNSGAFNNEKYEEIPLRGCVVTLPFQATITAVSMLWMIIILKIEQEEMND